MGWTARRVFIVSQDGAHAQLDNLPTIFAEYLKFPISEAKIILINVEDGSSTDTISVSHACELVKQLRLVEESNTVRVEEGLSAASLCFEFGKLTTTLTPRDHVFVVSDDPEMQHVLKIPTAENLVFVSPHAMAQTHRFELKYGAELFHNRFSARYAKPHAQQ